MSQLKKEERKQIEYFLSKKYSQRAIAEMLGRNVSTISREIKRNSVKGEYQAEKAQAKQYNRRYWVKKKVPKLWSLEWKPFKDFLDKHLKEKHPWSLDQICKRWSEENKSKTISLSTLYRFIHRWDRLLYKHLPHQRYNWKRRKKGSKIRGIIPNRIWIDERPQHVELREEIGHWEGDTLGSKKGETLNILGAIERKSRFLLAQILPNRKPKLSANRMKKWTEKYNIKSFTLDNGIEFQKHEEIGCKTYFCHPYSSWEKGQIEYAMRLIRRLVPKKSSLENVSQNQLQSFISNLNHMPRKCLNYKTPYEVFYNTSYLLS